jgi:hypothetical protein
MKMRLTMRIRLALSLLLVGITAVGCDRKGQQGSTTLDSVGSKIERGADKVGEKLDTAVSGIRTALNEADIQRMLHRMNGMDSVDVELTSGGDATLKGSVPSEEKRTEAERIVREIKGVHSVTNALSVGAAMRGDCSARRDTVPKSN